MHRLLPTQALTPSATPPIGASDTHIIRFAQTLNGYDECGGHEQLAAAVDAMPHIHAATLHQLRLKLFLTQRQHYFQGGSWGPEDPLMTGMRDICDRIRTLVLDQQSALLTWTGDITRLRVDAIVNPATPRLTGGGGLDGAIHQAAGPRLLQACKDIPESALGVRCPVGDVRLTPGFDLPAKYVLHTVGPRWSGGNSNEAALLERTYASCVSLALERHLQSIAFPAISTGAHRFPSRHAEQISTQTVHRLLRKSRATLRVLFVEFTDNAAG